jgi:SlyX protein
MKNTAEGAENRITELETRLEFQDETLGKLNDEMVLLQKRLFMQEKSLQLVMQKIQSQAEEEEGAKQEPEPPPPHY